MAEKVIVLADRRPKLEEPSSPVCELTCYDNGDVTIWMADVMQTAEQFNWLFAKLAGATGSIFDLKVERAGSE